MSIKSLTTNSFDQVIESHPLVLIDFWAEWCGPCKVFGNTLMEIAKDYPDVYFASVNIEEEKALAEEFAIRSIPFVMIIKNRTIVYAESGSLSAQVLRELLDQAKGIQDHK